MKRLVNSFVQGLLLVAPIALTVYVCWWVFRTIDGKRPVRGHGGPDMPVWGDAFARSDRGGDPETVKRLIQSLVDYLESIQARPVH